MNTVKKCIADYKKSVSFNQKQLKLTVSTLSLTRLEIPLPTIITVKFSLRCESY